MVIKEKMISAIMAAAIGACVLSGCNNVESSETNIETEIETGDVTMSEMAEKMVGRFNYDYRLYPEGTDYEQILDDYEELVKAGERKALHL